MNAQLMPVNNTYVPPIDNDSAIVSMTQRELNALIEHRINEALIMHTLRSSHAVVDGNVLIEVCNGKITHAEVLAKGSRVYDPRNSASVAGLVYHYIPAQQLGTLIEAATKRLVSIMNGNKH